MSLPFYDIANFEPDRSLGYLVRQVSRLSAQQIELSFVGRDLTLTHWIALAMVRHGIADTSAKIARQIGHDSGAMTRLVDQLEARGLVERQRCPDDRRVVFLTCTAEGLRQFDTLTPLLMGVWNEVLDGFEGVEVETLITLLTRLLVAFEARGARLPELAA